MKREKSNANDTIYRSRSVIMLTFFVQNVNNIQKNKTSYKRSRSINLYIFQKYKIKMKLWVETKNISMHIKPSEIEDFGPVYGILVQRESRSILSSLLNIERVVSKMLFCSMFFSFQMIIVTTWTVSTFRIEDNPGNVGKAFSRKYMKWLDPKE